MATYEENERVIKMKNSHKWTKIHVDEKTVAKGLPILVTNADGDQYHLEQCLGHGFEGEVWKVSLRTKETETGKIYALKFEIGDVDIGKQLKKEYETLKTLDHPCIVKAVKYWYDSVMGNDPHEYKRGHMLTEYISGIPLSKRKMVSKEESQKILLDLIIVCKYLNVEKKIYHGDLKPDNVMITDEKAQPVLVDFGFPGSIENEPYIDRKNLGLIYLRLIGLTDDQIHQFKTNLDWYTNFKKLYKLDEIVNAMRFVDSSILNMSRLALLLAFFDGTTHDDLYELMKKSM
jgi:serine/threonine protein kinase